MGGATMIMAKIVTDNLVNHGGWLAVVLLGILVIGMVGLLAYVIWEEEIRR